MIPTTTHSAVFVRVGALSALESCLFKWAIVWSTRSSNSNTLFPFILGTLLLVHERRKCAALCTKDSWGMPEYLTGLARHRPNPYLKRLQIGRAYQIGLVAGARGSRTHHPDRRAGANGFEVREGPPGPIRSRDRLLTRRREAQRSSR